MAVSDELRSRLDGIPAVDLAEYLAERFPEPEHGEDADPLLVMLAEVLDGRRVRQVVEYLARRCGHEDAQVCEMRFELERGRLRRSSFWRQRVGNVELEHLAAGTSSMAG